MKSPKDESAPSNPCTISDAELCAILENSSWARLEREAKEFGATTIEDTDDVAA
jgi:hypothetical protein